tara:strand:- start:299 stop:838 length:540 start_codon:yes stop_codon:yes gene_type:complete
MKNIQDLTKEKFLELESAGLSLDQILDSYEGSEEEKQNFREWKNKELKEIQKDNAKAGFLTDSEREEIDQIQLTTAFIINNREIEYEIDVITSECVYGMNVFRDIFTGIRDIAGGRSDASQKVLKDLRKTCLSELRAEALSLGADAVIGVDLDYSEISGGGKSGMLFLVASGTAVKLKP